MSEHQCKIVRVVDGDTVDVDIDLGFGVWLHNERIRIEGIDSPESRTRNLIEKFFGIAAKNRVKELLPKGSIQTLVCGDSGEGKFGRILGDFKLGDTRLTTLLLRDGYVVEYSGASKAAVMEQHLQNRIILLTNERVNLVEYQKLLDKINR